MPRISTRTKRVNLGNGTRVRLQNVRLDTVAAIRRLSLSLLDRGCCQQLPPPGSTVSLNLGDRQIMGRPELGGELSLFRPADFHQPHADAMYHDVLFSALSVSGVLAVFAALVLEQRLIFVSAKVRPHRCR